MFYNCHIHTFKEEDVPRRFLPFGMVGVLANATGFKIVVRTLNKINPFSDNDIFDRYVKFITIGKMGSQEKIFLECKRFYPSDFKFIVLTMDMEYMGAGKVPRPFKEQLKELSDLAGIYPDTIYPFVHIDPRRKEYMDILRESVEQWNFKGIKLYPPLGYFPYDPRLDPVYEYAARQNLPVISHGSPFNPVHYRGSLKNLKLLLSQSQNNLIIKSNKKKDLCSNFTNPDNFKPVLERYPTLRICLGHFGSSYYWNKYLDNPDQNENWFNKVRELLVSYPNLYTDISFTMFNREFFPLLKVLLSDPKINRKILFGSDYYMVETECKERRFALELRAYIGEDNFRLIATENPERFLGLVHA